MSNPYRKDVRHLDELDLYVLADLYDVKSHAVFHAIKKLICAGKRGAKDYEQDLMEAIESIERELQMLPVAAEDPAVEFDEQRIDAIGQNGNDGDHYGESWIAWNGGDCPVHPESVVQTILFGFDGLKTDRAKSLYWHHDKQDMSGCIRCYRVIENGVSKDWRLNVDWSMASPHHQFAFLGPNGVISFSMHQPMGYEFIGRPTAQ